MIKGFIFDLDGTLLDSLNVWEKVDQLFLEKRGISVTRDYQEALLNMRFLEAAHYTIDRYQLNQTVDEVMDEWMNEARKMYKHQVSLKPGVSTFLRTLKEKGYQLAIITSCHQELFEPCLKNNGIWHLFDIIVEANRMNMSKTESSIYKYTLNQMNINAEECIFIDDVYSSLKVANDLGINIVAMNDPLSYDQRIEHLTTHIISDFNDIQYLQNIIQ